MKKLILSICLLIFTSLTAQNVKPKFEKHGDLVKASYFFENGNIRQEGFFKGNKLTGTWVSFDKKGLKTAIATYCDGKKEGKWLVSCSKGLKEVTYKENKIIAVNSTNVALN